MIGLADCAVKRKYMTVENGKVTFPELPQVPVAEYVADVKEMKGVFVAMCLVPAYGVALLAVLVAVGLWIGGLGSWALWVLGGGFVCAGVVAAVNLWRGWETVKSLQGWFDEYDGPRHPESTGGV